MQKAWIALTVLFFLGCAASEEVTNAGVYGRGGPGQAGSGGEPDGSTAGSTSNPKGSGGSHSGSGGQAGQSGAAGTTTAKPCIHDDDCAVPNLCAGNNGQQCRGGFCVATGKPHVCDDGVPCTDDICDTNQNACTHTANDAACHAKQFCDRTRGCLDKLACSNPGGDAVCDRLNPGLTACTGLWKCDIEKSYCVQDPVPCGDRPNATTKCSVAESKAQCAWECQATFVDTNGDLNSVGQSNGCECKLTDPNDRPTLEMLDKNCDGIVGNKANAIFVAKTGRDDNPGTMEKPKLTINAGIEAARDAGKDVYVATGSYPESVKLYSGVSLYGGYDADKGWARSKDYQTRIESPTPVGVIARDIFAPTEIQLFKISSANAVDKGASSYAVKVINAQVEVTIRGCDLSPGAGAQGKDGGNGGKGAEGAKGDPANKDSGGKGAVSSCGATGGKGANGPPDPDPSNWAGAPGKEGGEGDPVGPIGGDGGQPGSAGLCKFIGSDAAGDAPDNAKVGGTGGPGAHGNVGYRFGTFDLTTGSYLPPIAGNGQIGKGGGGGGGGGSGGGGRCHIGTDCRYHFGGGGGGGGGGGCGGEGGKGGQSGGGSFALVTINALVLLEDTRLFSRTGGNGGKGGDGGAGGDPGDPGIGATGKKDDSGGKCGGDGARGAKGGSGGRGGGGAGGSGGPSIGIAYVGSQPIEVRTQFTPGSPGGSGGGGTDGESYARDGDDGLVEKARAATTN